MSQQTPNPDDIRLMVRELLRELLPAVLGTGQGLAERLRRAARADRGEVSVPVRSDADLDAFARAVADASRDATTLEAIAGGRVRFRLENTSPASPAPAKAPAPARTEGRIDAGVLSEKRVAELAKGHTRLILGPRVVLTPLGRDRARELGIEIVRSRT